MAAGNVVTDAAGAVKPAEVFDSLVADVEHKKVKVLK